MRITTLDISQILYNRINVNSVKSVISGEVYRDQRPSDSTKEDIVINVITSDSELIQDAVCNVNIHVPKLSSDLPNHVRMEAIVNVVNPIVEEANGDTYSFYTESQNFIKDPSIQEYYYNFRLRFRYHNTIIN